MLTHPEPIDWIESRAADLLKVVMRSRFRRSIFIDADQLQQAHGHLPDIALAIAARWWLGHAITGQLTLPPVSRFPTTQRNLDHVSRPTTLGAR